MSMAPLVLSGHLKDLGGGFTVRRLLPAVQCKSVGPFLFFDHFGPVTVQPTDEYDVRPHPHIGLSTVSYLLSGMITHRDSLGIRQDIKPGDVNWMTAGRGISHSERFTHPESFAGGGLELMQFWVALPEADEECEPAFDHYPQALMPEHETGGVWWRLFAGSAYGQTTPVRTHSPLFALHARLQPGATLALTGGHAEQAVYVARGAVTHGDTTAEPGQLLVFTGEGDSVTAGPDGATLMVFGGQPLGERHMFWNFVSSRRERIEQAKADWREGRFALPPDDHDEWIPLP